MRCAEPGVVSTPRMNDPLEDSSAVTVALVNSAIALDDRPPLRLLVLVGGSVATQALPATGSVTIGRSRSCEVRIDDDSISRQHAVIHLDDTISIEDLGSINGTVVRGKKLEPSSRHAVDIGELVQIGAARLLVEEAIAAPPAATAAPRDSGSRILLEPAMRSLAAVTERIAKTDLGVLLLGETGVGKDVFARAIHDASGRSGQYVPINCAALSDSLLESELFGHEKGAFTSAGAAKVGLLEAADDGTVLLDEIGDMPLPTQAKLLRVIEDRQIRRVGSVTSRQINVRFVAATNRDLQEDIERGTFRRDLFFRLNGVTLVIPPLRERISEIEPLARSFAERSARLAGRPRPDIDLEALCLLRDYSWPGNIRELRNVIERAVALCGNGPITPEQLPAERMKEPLKARTGASGAVAERRASAPDERARILAALDRANGNQTLAAKMLNISRRTLINRLDEFGVPRPRKEY
jgi:two-component system, NtrC family, response regulator AtoC